MLNKFNYKKYNSKFFKFIPHKVEKSIKLSYYKGWNKSLIIKVFFNSSNTINNLFIKKHFPKILNKEKIFIITSGKSKFNSKMRNFELKKLDAITTFADKFDYNFNCKKNTELFIISSEKFKTKKHKSIYFNFKKDIKVIDIWGGKCLSDLTLALI